MGIRPIDMNEIITDTLSTFMDGAYFSRAAVRLLMMTTAHESHCGRYLTQMGGGPALGVFQMELKTAQDIYENYLTYRYGLAGAVRLYRLPVMTIVQNLKANLPYQIVMARIHYLRDIEPIPNVMDLDGLANYYKRVWNTYKGKATPDQVIHDYFKYGKL